MGEIMNGEEVSERTGMSVNKIAALKNAMLPHLQLSSHIKTMDGPTVLETMTDPEDTAKVCEYDSQQLVDSILRILPKEQRKILTMYYGLNDGYSYTLKAIREVVGGSCQAVNNKRHAALKKLRNVRKSILLGAI